MENPFNTQENKPKRSTLLTVFLVLTFIGSGFSFLTNTFVALFPNAIIEALENFALDFDMEAIMEPTIAVFEQIGAWGFALSAILYLASLFGAFLMWKLNKRGFHFYAGAQIVILFTPLLLGVGGLPTIFATLLTALFIFVYARELKIFEKQQQQPVEE